VAERFAFSKAVTAQEAAEAEATMNAFRERFAALLGSDGVLVLPTVPDIAPRLDEGEEGLEDYRNKAIHLLCLSGLSGFPQVTIPAVTRLGAPLSLSLLGPAGSDLSLLRLAVRAAAAVTGRG
jgi:amidase